MTCPAEALYNTTFGFQVKICVGYLNCVVLRVQCIGYISHVMRKPVYAICEQQRRRSACTFAQCDQRLCCSLPRSYTASSFYVRNFKTLASFWSWAGQFESYLVANPEDRFSRDMAHIRKKSLRCLVQVQHWAMLYSKPCCNEQCYKEVEMSSDLSRDLTKPAKWVCAQRRLRSAWASAQSDQSPRCALSE